MCQCGIVPCPQAMLKLCATCGDIKKRVCCKGPCVAARQPLLLTMHEEPTAPLALPAPVEMEVEPQPLALTRPRRV